ncbi:hypothetical protein [Candidatus Endomicrobiellum trichonymphae]|uniref:hypothetical protein n=1 Tax=Endomicrobium trichonymphae TaxID=1408204 RepID=UPI000BBB0FDC|nr:hypothetical protein [Candidatus Endomicrobium trichonymphae]
MKITLEKILEQIDYAQLNNWQLPSISCFSENKNLEGFPYQKQALKNITKALYLSFKTFQNGNASPDKQTLHTKSDLKTKPLLYVNLQTIKIKA